MNQQNNLFIRSEAVGSLDKRSAKAHVPGSRFERRTHGKAVHDYTAGFSRMLSSLFVFVGLHDKAFRGVFLRIGRRGQIGEWVAKESPDICGMPRLLQRRRLPMHKSSKPLFGYTESWNMSRKGFYHCCQA